MLSLMASASLALAADDKQLSVNPKNTTSTGMGLVCYAAIIELVSRVGDRCVNDENPEIRKELNRATSALRNVLLTEGGVSQQELQAFLDRQAKHGVPEEQLCASEDIRRIYDSVTSNGVDELAKETDKVLALDGPPIWGTCL